MDGAPPNDSRPDVASDGLAELRRELSALRAEVEELRAGTHGEPPEITRPPLDAGSRPPADASPTMPRRQLLRTAGAVAVGGAAGAVASSVSAAAPASAADGQSLVLGQGNTATTPTILTGGAYPSPSAYFFVHDPADPIGTPLVENAAIAATAVGAKHGVEGLSLNAFGSGVFGIGGIGRGVGVRAAGVGANLQLDPAGPPPPTRNDLHQAGQLIEDQNGELWLCVGAGAPGAYRKVAGPSTAGAFHVLPAPGRVYDSRSGSPPATVAKGQLANGSSRVLDAKANASTVPAGASAILANLTVTQTSAQGFLALHRNGIPWPGNSSINWDHAGQTIANLSVVALDGNALFKAYVNQGSACDFLVDVVGYWR